MALTHDDHKYSLKRVVFYRHPDPGLPESTYGEGGPERTPGTILRVELRPGDPPIWEYTIRNWFNREVRVVPESEIFCGANHTHRRIVRKGASPEPELESSLSHFVETSISEMVRLEGEMDAARARGWDHPLAPGDYVRISGEYRREMERFDGLYAKVLNVAPADIAAIEPDPGRAGARTHGVRTKYRVLVEGGAEVEVYDPEIKKYYTTGGRSVILNWRAAAFLAEIFGDPAPYNVDLDYLSEHVYTRAELAGLSREQLIDLLVDLQYAKGQLGWRDREARRRELGRASEGYLIDHLLYLSRFDMRRNRPMTPEEVLERRSQQERLGGILGS